MLFNTNQEKGCAGLSLAIAYFGANGYTVNIPMNDTQWYDLVVEKEGVFYTVQCKTTGSKDGRIDFRSTGGTNGKVYDHVLNHKLDYIFSVNQNGTLFLFPVSEILKYKSRNGITLREIPQSNFANKNILDASNYIVQI